MAGTLYTNMLRRSVNLGFLIVVSISSFCGFAQQSPENLQRIILPYLEAPETPVDPGSSASRVFWLSESRVAYTARKPGVSLSDRLELQNDISTTKYEVSDQVVFFDVDNQNIQKHSDGRLVDIERGEITIVLREVRTTDYYRSRNLEGSYDLRLVGPIGHEQKRTFQLASQVPRLLKCPTDPKPENAGTNIALGHGFGCLYHPTTSNTRNWNWSYFRPDGAVIPIDAVSVDVGYSRWVQWLGVYVLRTDISKGAVQPGPDPRLILLWPDGRTKVIPNNRTHFSAFSDAHRALPTRAGMVVVVPGNDPPRSSDGIYLWNGDASLQIAQGVVSTVEGSPDGCRVAYVVRPSSRNVVAARLRVIDVCKAVNIPKTANPFQ